MEIDCIVFVLNLLHSQHNVRIDGERDNESREVDGGRQ